MSKHLIVVRAGDESLHPNWLSYSTPNNFDVYVSCFGNNPEKYRDSAAFLDHTPGLKWPVIFDLLEGKSHLLQGYDAFWFPDDDLLTDAKTINRMFELFDAHELWLAQPALGPGSHIGFKATAQIPACRLRYTGFVEVMCPIFSRHSLEVLKHTFGISQTGWGLDFLWPKLLGYPRDRIAIIDETPVVHARKLRTGSFYANCREMAISPQSEMADLFTKYGLEWSANIPVYGHVKHGDQPPTQSPQPTFPGNPQMNPGG